MHTIGLPVTSVMGTVFRGADADSQVNYLARSLAFQVHPLHTHLSHMILVISSKPGDRSRLCTS